MNWLLRTSDSPALLLVRLALGVVFFPHGAQKTFGWFGGNGFSATMDHFTQNMGIPWIFALLAILAEFLGAIGLVLGLLTRVAALGIASVMVVAIFEVHAQYGFFMNWKGNQQGEGFEYHLLALGMALALLLSGGGALSIDRALTVGRKR